MVVCVVSAFYSIPSKFSVERYFEWMTPFFQQTPFHMVLFTQPEFVEPFKQMRRQWTDRTIVASLPPEEITALKKWGSNTWIETAKKDHETSHSPELYCMWYEKKEFVLRAIEMGAFGAKTFVWCDAGILRFTNWIPHIQTFPEENRIAPGKMTLLSLVPFSEGETVNTDFQKVNRIGGGIQAADAATWRWWSIQYDSMMIQYQLSNRFIGKDQNIMSSLCLLHPDRVHLVLAPSELDGYTKWFWLLLWLSGIGV